MNSYISSPSKTSEILSQYSIKLKKSLGQNFLIDTNVLKKIIRAAELKPDDVVLEIGSGIGSLTELMLSCVKKVICIEIDSLLAGAFRNIFSKNIGSNLELIEADALRLNYEEICGRYSVNKIVSNLPYKIAAPLIIKILLEPTEIKTMYLTIQKDIAARFLAKVGDKNKNYSSYTVKSNFLADFAVLFSISRNCFMPKPFVDSVVVKTSQKDIIENIKSLGVNRAAVNKVVGSKAAGGKAAGGKAADTKAPAERILAFFNFIDKCFTHRRKKLVNSLFGGSPKNIDKIDLTVKMLSDIGKGRDARAEELTLADYLFLYNNLKAGF
jgi:16S rRNA (adenine1518-N6/adenine1519-N6)-dimethyltransferase